MKAAVMGYGTIGSGVVEVLDINKNSIAKRAGEEIGVKYILDLRDFPGDPIQEKVVHDYKVIANDPEVQIVVEGVFSAKAALQLAKKYNVEMPIVEQVNEVLFDDKSPADAVRELMLRDKKIEGNNNIEWKE